MKICLYLIAASMAWLFVTPAQAHPHVWVTVTSQVVYDAKGAATGVRHAWKFDDMYSAFALEGLQRGTKAVFSREDLAPLAEVNITSLKDSDFFTFTKVGSNDVGFGSATDYWLDYKDEVLTLNFTLPFKTPVKAKDLVIEVYDPTYFVDFSFAEKDAVSLIGAPAQCKATVEKPKDKSFSVGNQNPTAFMSSNWGVNFASKIVVKCQ